MKRLAATLVLVPVLLLLAGCGSSKDETAATAIEYGLIAAGIAIAIITAVKGVGTKLSTNFNTISTSLK